MAKLTKTKTQKDMTKPDLRWFRSLIEQNGTTQHKISKILDIPTSSFSLFLHGKRKLQSHEAARLSEILGRSLEDILIHAGVAVDFPAYKEGFGVTGKKGEERRSIDITGHLDGELRVVWGLVAGSRRAPCPFQGADDLRCLRIQSAGSKFGGLDGTLVYFRMPKKPALDLECLGKLSMVRLKGESHAALRMRVLIRGYNPGTFTLRGFGGEILESEVVVENAQPVLWLRA